MLTLVGGNPSWHLGELYSFCKQRRMIRIVHTAADLWGKNIVNGPHNNNIRCKGWALRDSLSHVAWAWLQGGSIGGVGGGASHWLESVHRRGRDSPRGELQESSVLTSPPASDVLQNAQGDLTSPVNFPGAANHFRRTSPSTCEDFSCLLHCWCSCLVLSSPSLRTSLWRSPTALKRSNVVHPLEAEESSSTFLLLLDRGARFCKYKLFFLSCKAPRIIDKKNRTETQKRIH